MLLTGVVFQPDTATAAVPVSDLICTSDSAAVDLNTASWRDVVAAVPGVGRKAAEALIDDRPLYPSIETLSAVSRANSRALERSANRDRFCFSVGPFDHPDGGSILLALPNEETLVEHEDRWMRIPGSALSEPCFASISTPADVPDSGDPKTQLSEGDGADYHLDCIWAGTVDVSWMTDYSELGTDRGTYLAAHHSADNGWMYEEVTEVFSDGRVVVEVDNLSWFSDRISSFLAPLTWFTAPTVQPPDPVPPLGPQLLDLGLNDAEVAFCNGYWYWTCVRNAVTSARVNATLQQEGRNLYGNTGPDNALGHCTWVAFLTFEDGYDFAIGFSDAHEDGSVAPFGIDSMMDRHNNAVGASNGLVSSSLSDAYARCKVSEANGELRYISGGVLCPTDQTCDAPPPPPPPPNGGLTITLTENPFACNGATRSMGVLSGATPGELITFESPQVGSLIAGNADGQGTLGLIWTCTAQDVGTTWNVTAIGTSSGKVGSFSLVGG